ncbi:hypothetical protein L3Q82_002404 [Scortum barcoo]|uniref:Uncharacterized protein n=1 Tax=Scortum barcoo TaxID=214431 RepID=A0ACB8W013_9TELE|nr:hypothetical protein L3Q82_002404 [Scortum barcoo]
MYIKFCRGYGEVKKDEAKANLSPGSKLSVELEGEKGNQTEGNARLYRAGCIFLTIICLVLLLVVVILSVKHLGCRQCADGWLTLGRSCFYLSKFRLNWAESQRNCSARGGSLAVVSSPTIQNFLTEKGKMSYWIGLKHNGAAWTWVNNTVLRESYWAEVPPPEGCGLLSSRSPPEANWVTAACNAYSFFICQLHM